MIVQSLPKENLDTIFEYLDLTKVMSKLKIEGMSENEAQKAEFQYRLFLQLHQKFPHIRLVPNNLVDKVWHQHILFTRMYFSDCQVLFGDYFHHLPNLGTNQSMHSHMNSTKQLYLQEFGIAFFYEILSQSDCHQGCAGCNDDSQGCGGDNELV